MSPSSQKLNAQQSRVLTRTGYRHHAELSPERNMSVTRTRTCTGTRGWRCTQAAQVLAAALMTDVIGHARGHVRDTPGTALRHAPLAPTRRALAATRPRRPTQAPLAGSAHTPRSAPTDLPNLRRKAPGSPRPGHKHSSLRCSVIEDTHMQVSTTKDILRSNCCSTIHT